MVEPSGETKLNDMDKASGRAPSDKNVLGFDIAVNAMSRVDKFQVEMLV
jgi:hypothetical protein